MESFSSKYFSDFFSAFSFFSVCEYGIAITNIGFHYTAATDFKKNYWYLGAPPDSDTDNHIQTDSVKNCKSA